MANTSGKYGVAQRRYLSLIAGDVELSRALGVLSLLPEVGVDGSMGGELDALCRALGVNVDEIRSRIGSLVRHGLVRRRGRFVEVIPSRLAERLAGETLGRPDLQIAELLAALEPPTFVRFLRRLRDLARPEVADAIEQLLRRWVSDSESPTRSAGNGRHGLDTGAVVISLLSPIQRVVLEAFFRGGPRADDFYLTGGTALAGFYLR